MCHLLTLYCNEELSLACRCRHEGRTWYSTHRGRLWIAAAAKIPDREEVKKVEDFYRSYYEGEGGVCTCMFG